MIVESLPACPDGCCHATRDTDLPAPQGSTRVPRPMFELIADARTALANQAPHNVYLENGTPVDDWHF